MIPALIIETFVYDVGFGVIDGAGSAHHNFSASDKVLIYPIHGSIVRTRIRANAGTGYLYIINIPISPVGATDTSSLVRSFDVSNSCSKRRAGEISLVHKNASICHTGILGDICQ